VPQKWELSMQNQMLESLVTQGYNAFLIFPGDPVGTVAIANELAATGAPVLALAGCLQDPSNAQFCMGTDTGNSAYIGTQELLEGPAGRARRSRTSRASSSIRTPSSASMRWRRLRRKAGRR
jgi:ribose transport system substrate-binding protein